MSRRSAGRGSEPAYPYLDWWLKEAEEHGPYRLGVDTALAAESVAELEAAGVPDWMFHVEDGRFSAYIDAVQMTMAPSSFEPARPSWAFDEQWLKSWLKSQDAPC